jgi:hypothetical protein
MTSDTPNGHRPDDTVDLNAEVAELAGELSEAKTASRRKKIASQLPALASRTKSWRGLQSGGQAAWKGLQSGGGAAARRMRPARDAAARGGQAGSGVARKSVRASRSRAWHGLRASGEWLAGQVMEMAPKVPIRSISTLRAQYPGRETEELADLLITSAARASAGVGAAIGVAAAVPFVPTAPVELTVETLALVAIELKLIAELHEVYGMAVPGPATERMIAYVGAWTNRRGVSITGGGLALVMGSQLRRKLQRRLLAKAGQSTLSLAPLLTGAAAGAMIDHRETRRLGTLVRNDLRKRGTERAALAE